MRIPLTKTQVLCYSRQYSFDSDHKLGDRLVKGVMRGYLTRGDLIEVARWKWRGGRTRQLVRQNTQAEVREISKVSFSASSERLRIGALLALHGVSWPMASVILHFSFPEQYPILDVRAMRTVNGSTVYNFERWLEYVELCRETARHMDVAMRVLDRALWAVDKSKKKCCDGTSNRITTIV